MKPALVLLLALASPLAHADDEALRRCRALADTAARLACYDALPLAGAPAGGSPGAPAVAPARAQTAVAVPGASSTTAHGMTQSAQAYVAPPAATVPAASAAASFGLDRPRDEVQEVVSTIPGAFEGWGPHTRFRLANGQVWQVADDSSAVYVLDSPRVTIRKAVLSGFVMEVEGARRELRVKRLE